MAPLSVCVVWLWISSVEAHFKETYSAHFQVHNFLVWVVTRIVFHALMDKKYSNSPIVSSAAALYSPYVLNTLF